jgi:hypothetical protein
MENSNLEDNIDMDLREMDCEDERWIDMTPAAAYWRPLVLRFYYQRANPI